MLSHKQFNIDYEDTVNVRLTDISLESISICRKKSTDIVTGPEGFGRKNFKIRTQSEVHFE
jgi:hypothetical protein